MAHTWLPELQVVAITVLSQPCSASAAERNWSVYGQIKSAARKRMQHLVADKLVFCHESPHYQNKLQNAAHRHEVAEWDEAGSSQCWGGGISAEKCNRRTTGSLEVIKVSLETELKTLSKYIGGRRSTPALRRAIFYKTVARSLGNRARAWLCALFRAPEATTGAALALPPLIWRLRWTQGVRCVYHAGLEAVLSFS